MRTLAAPSEGDVAWTRIPPQFAQQHHDVARRHEHALLDVFAVEHLDSRRDVVQPLVGAGCRYCHLFLGGRGGLQLDDGFVNLGLIRGKRRGPRGFPVCREQRSSRFARSRRPAAESDLGPGNRPVLATHLDANLSLTGFG